MRKSGQIAVFCVMLFLSSLALAVEYRVSQDGSGDFTAIQEAIDASVDGDVIIVDPGTYYENIRFEGKNIVLTSEDPEDPQAVASTIIDGRGIDSVIAFAGTEDESCKLKGLTITNGSSRDGGGVCGGLLYYAEAKASIERCLITGNTATDGGGVYGCAGTISDCVITDNTALESGGGIFSSGRVQRCVIARNTAGGNGGGINASGPIEGCLIFGNSAWSGGGVNWGWIVSCTITDNIAGYGGGVSGSAVLDSIIWGNWAPEGVEVYSDPWDTSEASYSYCCIREYDGEGVGNISDDPLYVDPEGGDYHLEPYSACIDGGDNSALQSDVDLDMRPRIVNRRTDIGAYEHLDGCWITVSTDDEMYWGSVEMALSVEAGAFGPGETVDLYAAMRFPDGRLLSIPSLSTNHSPWVSGQELPPGFVFMPLDDFSYRFSPDDPDGIYIIYAALFPHGSFDNAEPLTDIASCSFKYHRAGPAEIHVNKDGTGRFTSIQDAIDASEAGDTIIVHPGTYYEDIVLNGKDLTLRSTDPEDRAIVGSTVISGSGNQDTLDFWGAETEAFVLSGLTITGVRGSSHLIYPCVLGHGCKATIINCMLTSNDSTSSGLDNCDGLIENCLISGNLCCGLSGCDGDIVGCKITGNSACQYGGGGLYSCNGRIIDCLISENSATGTPDVAFGGGGLAECDGLIEGCTISDNYSACYGGGLYLCDGVISNCVIRDNEAAYGGSALCSVSASVVNCTIVNNPHYGSIGWFRGEIVNCIVWEEETLLDEEDEVSYSCVKNWTAGGEGNISEDPLFADPANGDHRLRPGSPCINAGINSAVAGETDIAELPRIIGAVVDMGAHEYPDGCYVSVTTDQELHTGADQMTLHLTAGNFGYPQLVDIYAAMAFRGRELLFIPNLTSVWAPWSSGFELQQGAGFAGSFVYPFAGTEPEGTSLAYAAVFPNGSSDFGDILTNVASCSFKYHRAGTAEFHVIQDGTGDFSTIQGAIDASLDGDTIIVHPGTYRESIDSLGKSMAIRSVDPSDAQTVICTIIQGQPEEAVVTPRWADDGLCEISGLTITGGYTGIGAPGYSWPQAKVRISNCIVSDNGGTGIYECDGDIENCLIRTNYGCGIKDFGGNVRDCFVIGNSEVGLCRCTGEIVNCLVSGNTTSWNGGGMCYCSGNITNCTVAGNSAGNHGGGLFGCDGRIQNCIIWGNTAPEGGETGDSSEIKYCCIRDFAGDGRGNISEDPLFVTGPLGDYYLNPNSPCINAGLGTPKDFGLEGFTTRTDGAPDTGAVDMGFHYPIP